MACLNPQTLRQKSLVFCVASNFWQSNSRLPPQALADAPNQRNRPLVARSLGRPQEDDMTLIVMTAKAILSSLTEF